MQVLELVVESGLTHLACGCRPHVARTAPPEQTFTVHQGARVIARCLFCEGTVEFDLPRRAELPVERLDDGAVPRRLGATMSFVYLRSAGFHLNVVNGSRRDHCYCPR